MKNLCVIYLVLSFIFFGTAITSVEAQDANPQSVGITNDCGDEYLSLGQGESPVASGFFVATGTTCNGGNVDLAFGPINGYVTYKWSDLAGMNDLDAGPSTGVFSGVPWVGPIANYSFGPIDLLGWVGISAGDAQTGELKYKIELAFTQADVRLNITDNLYTSFTYLDFGGDFYLQTIGGSVPVSEEFSIFSSVTYDIENKEPQFFIGMKFTNFLN